MDNAGRYIFTICFPLHTQQFITVNYIQFNVLTWIFHVIIKQNVWKSI